MGFIYVIMVYGRFGKNIVCVADTLEKAIQVTNDVHDEIIENEQYEYTSLHVYEMKMNVVNFDDFLYPKYDIVIDFE